VIDLLENPLLAEQDKIIAVPTLIRKFPEPIRKIIGDLSNSAMALEGLQLPVSPPAFAEGEAVLAAICAGEVDAFIGGDGNVFHLNGGDRPYVTFFNAMNEGGVTVDSNGLILHGNSRFAAMLGRPLEMLRGTSLVACFASADRPRIAAMLLTLEAAICEVTLNTFDGQLPVRLSLQKIATGLQEFGCLVISDLSESAQAREALLEGNATLRAILETSLDGFWQVGTDGRLLDVNNAYCEQSGYTRDELLQMRIGDLDALEDSEVTATRIRNIITKGHDRFVSTQRSKNGTLRSVEISITYHSADGGCFYVFLRNLAERKVAEGEIRVHRDFLKTELKRQEQALKTSHAFNQSILNSLTAEIAVVNMQDTIVAVNAPWLHFATETGIESGVGSKYFDVCRTGGRFADAHDAERAYKGLRAVANGRLHRFDLDYVSHAAAQQRWFTMSVTPLAHEGRGRVVVTHTEITERRQAEQQSAKLFQVVEQSPVSIVITDPRGVIEYVNPSFARTTGYERNEAIGRTSSFLRSELTPQETYRELWQTIRTGCVWRGVLRNRTKSGTLIWESLTISPIVDAEGQITHFVAAKQDLTENKQLSEQLETYRTHLEDLVVQRTAELSDALDAARRADRAKDEFLANITHELRTPLAAVIGFSSLARPFCTDARQCEYLDKVNSAGKTLADIIDDLLDLSKIVAGRLEFDIKPFSLRQLVTRSNSLISFKVEEKGLQLVERVDTEIPDILLGDSLRIEQILLNLLSNAVKFTAAGRVELRFLLHAREAERVCLSIEVEDTGIGLREEEIALLFKPFSQADASVTRRFGGTGLGLAICKRLAEIMDGDISVTSLAGRGTTFQVRLWLGLAKAGELPPMAEEAPETTSAQVRYEGARVLVVDDQAFNRDVVAGLLAVVGIVPELASNGQEAIDILCGAADAFDLVLMDIQMPLMDGLTATRVIRSLEGFARLPIVAMTAHTMVHEREKAVDAGLNDHVGKPFDEGSFYRLLSKWIPQDKQQRLIAATHRATTVSGLPPLRGVDTRAGLALLLGDTTRYRKALSDFAAEAPITLKQIRHAVDAGELAPASMTAHILKGRTGLLGMQELHAAAAALEQALEQALDSAQPPAELLQALEQGIAAMTAEIHGKLGYGPVAASAGVAKPPPGVTPASVTRLIARLQAGDSDCDILVTDCLRELEDTAWAPPLQQAQSHIRKFDFAAAILQLADGQREDNKERLDGKTDPAG